MELNVPTPSPGIARQGAIYLAGMAQGRKPAIPLRPEALEQAAQAKLSPEAFAYIAGGAGRELTMSANLAAFERRRIIPRMLRDVSTRSLQTTLLGKPRPHPILAAPIGVQELAHPDADLAAARACAALGVPFVISNQASHSMEEIAAAMGDAPRWFQLYWSKSDDLVASLVRRAEGCGCEAIVVTLDTTMLGWRTRDLELGYLPFLQGRGIAQYTSDPVFLAMLGDRAGDRQAAAMLFMQIYSNPALTWNRLAFLRQHTKLPILLKGINLVADADAALEAGMDGIIVSNHGGRQLDGGIAALDALDLIAQSHAGKLPILFDSGVRTGADIFKALALGADAVLIGRPYIYGLALEGQTGVTEVLQNLIAELDLTMGLAGCSTPSEISRASVA
jgi:lactate 2-monooxygenase